MTKEQLLDRLVELAHDLEGMAQRYRKANNVGGYVAYEDALEQVQRILREA